MAVPTKTGSATNQSFPARIGRYFREVRSELRKVVWPTRQELLTYTVVVLVTVAIVSLFLGVVDIAVSELLTLLAGLGR
ncbi:MAG: preprotein translocase subunit SecE [Limnochordales bacterium]|jgi:preprotein translocase, SecE subunit, bacterial|nr:preprotein translocase subunit SecE [Bacillota bacterium]